MQLILHYDETRSAYPARGSGPEGKEGFWADYFVVLTVYWLVTSLTGFACRLSSCTKFDLYIVAKQSSTMMSATLQSNRLCKRWAACEQTTEVQKPSHTLLSQGQVMAAKLLQSTWMP